MYDTWSIIYISFRKNKGPKKDHFTHFTHSLHSQNKKISNFGSKLPPEIRYFWNLFWKIHIPIRNLNFLRATLQHYQNIKPIKSCCAQFPLVAINVYTWSIIYISFRKNKGPKKHHFFFHFRFTFTFTSLHN